MRNPMNRYAALLILLVAVAVAAPGQAQAPPQRAELAALEARLEQLAASFPGTVGLYARHLETGEEASVNPDRLFPMASVYKVPIMVQVFRDAEAGRLSLEERVKLAEEHRRLGSGLLAYMRPGLEPTIYDLVLLMITISDNEAADLLLARVGAERVTATMRELGLASIRVDRPTAGLIGDWLALADESFRGKTPAELLSTPGVFATITPAAREKASQEFAKVMMDVASPRALAELLGKIYRGQAASEKSCRAMREILGHQQFTQRIPRFLPGFTEVENKTGTIGLSTNDAGLVFVGGQPVALAIFTQKSSTRVPTVEAEERIGELARAVFDYFRYAGKPEPAKPAP